eukprot:7167299-Alexandrium_andersonii.AAC.1
MSATEPLVQQMVPARQPEWTQLQGTTVGMALRGWQGQLSRLIPSSRADFSLQGSPETDLDGVQESE